MNEKTMTINIQRGEMCDLLLACLAAKELANDGGKKWDNLHEKLKDMIESFDGKPNTLR